MGCCGSKEQKRKSTQDPAIQYEVVAPPSRSSSVSTTKNVVVSTETQPSQQIHQETNKRFKREVPNPHPASTVPLEGKKNAKQSQIPSNLNWICIDVGNHSSSVGYWDVKNPKWFGF